MVLENLLPLDTTDRDMAKLVEGLDDAIADCKKHRRAIAHGDTYYQPHITHKP